MTGKRISQFSVAATSIEPNDLFGIDQDVGGGVFQTKKAARKLLPDIKFLIRNVDESRAAAVFTDDPILTTQLVAGTTYFIRSRLIFTPVIGTSVANYGWTQPALTSSFQDSVRYQDIAGPAHTYNAAPFLLAITSAAGNVLVTDDVITLQPSASGTFAVKWGGITATVIMKAGSFVEIHKFTP